MLERSLNPALSATGRSGGPLSLRHNISWTFLGNGISAACQWAILVVIAKLGQASLVGQFGLALAITAPILLFAGLNLRGVIATDARREHPFSDYLRLRLVLLAAALLVVVGVLVVMRMNAQTGGVLVMVTLAKIFDSISDIIYGLLQQRERMDRIAISRILQGVLQITLLGTVLYRTGSLLWATAALAAASAAVTVFYDWPALGWVLRQPEPDAPEKTSETATDGPLPARKNPLYRLALIALPLGIVGVFDSLHVNIPRYVIQAELGSSAVGYFSATGYLMMTGAVVVNALGQAATPRLARDFLARQTQFRRLTLRLAWMGLLIGLAGILLAVVAGRPLLIALYRSDYAAYHSVLIWFMVCATVWYVATFLWYAATAARLFRAQALLQILTDIVTTIGCFAWIPTHGLIGAVWALTAGMAVRLIGGFGMLYSATRKPQKR